MYSLIFMCAMLWRNRRSISQIKSTNSKQYKWYTPNCCCHFGCLKLHMLKTFRVNRKWYKVCTNSRMQHWDYWQYLKTKMLFTKGCMILCIRFVHSEGSHHILNLNSFSLHFCCALHCTPRTLLLAMGMLLLIWSKTNQPLTHTKHHHSTAVTTGQVSAWGGYFIEGCNGEQQLLTVKAVKWYKDVVWYTI